MSGPVYPKCNLNLLFVRYTIYGHYRPKLQQKQQHKKRDVCHIDGSVVHSAESSQMLYITLCNVTCYT